MGGQWVEEGMPPSNLQCFLDCTTPTVETHILPKVTQLPPVNLSPSVFFLVFCPRLAMVAVDLRCPGSFGFVIYYSFSLPAPLSVVGVEKMGFLLLVLFYYAY